MRDPLALFRTNRFWPLFVGQFIGALGDNLFRSALVTHVTFTLAASQGFDPKPIVTMAIGIFMLPYFLFSATAGKLADKFDKAWLMRRLKAVEIGVLALAGLALAMDHVNMMLAVLFLAGTQSAFYAPVKYAILPQHLKEDELLSGNALVGAGTFLAILLGTIMGTLLVTQGHGPYLVAVCMVLLSVAGYLVTRFIPAAAPAAPELKISFNPLLETWPVLKSAYSQKGIPLVLLGHAWFWLVGSLYLGQMPTLIKEGLNATEGVYITIFTCFSVGVGLGAFVINRLLKGEVNGRFLPLSALAMAIVGVHLAVKLDNFIPAEMAMSVADFFSRPSSWSVLGGFLFLSAAAGSYIVPLNAMLQARATPEARARTVAASNIIDALGMVVGSVVAALLLGMGMSIPQFWFALALLSFPAALIITMLIPQDVLKGLFRSLLRLCYAVKVHGAENLQAAGPKAVIVANHVSLLDGLLLGAFLPGKPVFAVNSIIARAWWAKIFLQLVDTYEIDPTSPMALKGLIHTVNSGRQCVIFPEGRITTTGSLMKVNEGPGVIADKAKAPLVPVRIEGAQYTPFSYLEGLRRRWFPPISLTILPPTTFELPEGLTARSRRQLAGRKLYDLMSDLILRTSPTDVTLVEATLEAAHLHGHHRAVLEDVKREPMSYAKLQLGMLVLGRKFAPLAPVGGRVGLLLPNVNATPTAMLALMLYGRVPAMLNYTAGLANLQAACKAASLQHIITSRAFIAQAKLEAVMEGLSSQCQFTYLEDVREGVSALNKLAALISRPFIRTIHKRVGVKADDAAVVLFTSGSEGTPKGVVLSHKNLVANRYQVGARIDFSPADVILNALPLFHSFGLTGGLLIPLLSGARTFLYPSPLHYRIVPLLAYDINATILFGTDTFLTGYARMAHPYDFYSLRFVCAGAERVKDETRRTYADKFGVRIFEGYGTTETAPVLAMNTPLYTRNGTVGRLLPGMTAKLTPVPGIEEGGRLSVTGPNVLMGYLKADNPGVLEAPETDESGRWHDTGDIVTIDAEGFIAIKGRAKRFAKIAGEMVSLAAVEEVAIKTWPEHAHASINLPDDKKGEQIVLLTTNPTAQLAELQATLKQKGLPELMCPKRLLVVEALPLLGSGKTDYVAAKALAEASAA